MRVAVAKEYAELLAAGTDEPKAKDYALQAANRCDVMTKLLSGERPRFAEASVMWRAIQKSIRRAERWAVHGRAAS